MPDLSPAERLEKLRAVEAWLDFQLGQTRQRIRDLEAQAAPVGYLLEPKMHPTHPQPVIVHTADCTMAHRTPKPISEREARTALADPVIAAEACQFCQPDAGLNH